MAFLLITTAGDDHLGSFFLREQGQRRGHAIAIAVEADACGLLQGGLGTATETDDDICGLHVRQDDRWQAILKPRHEPARGRGAGKKGHHQPDQSGQCHAAPLTEPEAACQPDAEQQPHDPDRVGEENHLLEENHAGCERG